VIESEESRQIEKRLIRYRLYHAPIILQEFISQSFYNDTKKSSKFRLLLLIELLHKEKFVNYIKRPIESRFLDFIKSKQYSAEIVDEVEPKGLINESEELETILDSLSSDEKIIYRLKYGIRVDNREFLTITYRINYMDRGLLDVFTPDEKLYIKFSVHYEIDDRSEHFSMIDVERVKESIFQKISDYRGKLESHSYIEEQEEIFIKLIYCEALSAKEIGVVFNLTSKQIDKKVENIKKKLKRLEHKL